MKTFIATVDDDTGEIVEFEAEDLKTAIILAEGHGFFNVKEIEIIVTLPASTPIDEVIEIGKAVIDSKFGVKH